jgi:hypothetical protein
MIHHIVPEIDDELAKTRPARRLKGPNFHLDNAPVRMPQTGA